MMAAPAPQASMRRLYPPVEPHASGMLDSGDGHQIYWECSGNPKGKPVIFLHGGPGGGTSPVQRRFFDPARYHIILMDQRGCGRSRPHAGLENNSSPHLIGDLETLRTHLGVEAWIVFGGSWGSTLALLYAQAHPERVEALILRGIFLARDSEIEWFYKSGANRLFPEAWADFTAPIPEAEQADLIAAYYSRLTHKDLAVRSRAARHWSHWERATVTLKADMRPMPADTQAHALAIARIECHYFKNRCFLESDSQIIDAMGRIDHLPGVIVQGRYDVICPPVSAVELAKSWPAADLKIVPLAGHSAFEPGIVHELILATDRFAD